MAAKYASLALSPPPTAVMYKYEPARPPSASQAKVPYSGSPRPGRPRLFQNTQPAAASAAARIAMPIAFAPPAKNGSTRGPTKSNAEPMCASGLAAARFIS